MCVFVRVCVCSCGRWSAPGPIPRSLITHRPVNSTRVCQMIGGPSGGEAGRARGREEQHAARVNGLGTSEGRSRFKGGRVSGKRR